MMVNSLGSFGAFHVSRSDFEQWQLGRNRCIDSRAWPYFREFHSNTSRSLYTGGKKDRSIPLTIKTSQDMCKRSSWDVKIIVGVPSGLAIQHDEV